MSAIAGRHFSAAQLNDTVWFYHVKKEKAVKRFPDAEKVVTLTTSIMSAVYRGFLMADRDAARVYYFY